MMADVSEFLLEDGSGCMLSPDTIVVDGESFLVETDCQPDDKYLSPEQREGEKPATPQQVWQLGAIAWYMATGHVIFGGHGGSYQRQHPQVALPVLPKAFQQLTPVVQRCLHPSPSRRIGLEELRTAVNNGLAVCSRRQRARFKADVQCSASNVQRPMFNVQCPKWPEEMIEI